MNIENYKAFKALPEQYKSTKFCKLYYKMYNYMLSIPKEKIVISHIIKYNSYGEYLFRYISYFLEAKDFYYWKNRIYSLLTEKIGAKNYRKYELLYGSNAKEFINKTLEKSKSTSIIKYNTDNPAKSDEIKKKISNTKINKSQEEKEQIKEKRKATNLKIYGVECNLLLDECKRNCNNHSKPSDEMCEYIDKYFGYPEDSWYAIKNKELHLVSENKRYYYDYVNTKYKFIIEFNGKYWHALYKNPDDIIIYPGGKTKLAKEVWAIDEKKKLLAEQNGYKVFYVYEDEYRNNKFKCLENLIKEIKNYVHSLENDI